MHQPGRGQPERLAAAARPPGEGHRRVEQRQRRLDQRQRRVAAGHDQRRPRRPDRPHQRWCPAAPGPGPRGGRPPAGRKPARVAVAPDSGSATSESPTGASTTRPPAVAERRQRAGRHQGRRAARPEQLLDRHPQRMGQRQRHPQRRVRQPGLDRRDGLPRDPGHPGQLLLGEPAGLPGEPQPRAARSPAPGSAAHAPRHPAPRPGAASFRRRAVRASGRAVRPEARRVQGRDHQLAVRRRPGRSAQLAGDLGRPDAQVGLPAGPGGRPPVMMPVSTMPRSGCAPAITRSGWIPATMSPPSGAPAAPGLAAGPARTPGSRPARRPGARPGAAPPRAGGPSCSRVPRSMTASRSAKAWASASSCATSTAGICAVGDQPADQAGQRPAQAASSPV